MTLTRIKPVRLKSPESRQCLELLTITHPKSGKGFSHLPDTDCAAELDSLRFSYELFFERGKCQEKSASLSH